MLEIIKISNIRCIRLGEQIVREERDKDSFRTGYQYMPNLGKLYFWGTTGSTYLLEFPGVRVEGKKLVFGRAQMFRDQGFFDLNIAVYGLPKTPRPLVSRLKVEGIPLVLQGEFSFGEDRLEQDPIERYNAGVSDWTLAHTNIDNLVFFVEPTPQGLSRLSFDIETV